MKEDIWIEGTDSGSTTAYTSSQFKRGGEPLLDALSTFTATELSSYNNFVALTVNVNTPTLTRVDLKKKPINATEVVQALPKVPVLDGDILLNEVQRLSKVLY